MLKTNANAARLQPIITNQLKQLIELVHSSAAFCCCRWSLYRRVRMRLSRRLVTGFISSHIRRQLWLQKPVHEQNCSMFCQSWRSIKKTSSSCDSGSEGPVKMSRIITCSKQIHTMNSTYIDACWIQDHVQSEVHLQ